MRVLLIDTNSVRVGEQEKAAALAAAGHRVTLLAPRRFRENYKELQAHQPHNPPYRLILAPMMGKPPNRCIFTSGLAEAMRSKPEAILVLADENFWLTGQALAWRGILCPRALFLCHSWQNLDFDRHCHPQPSSLLYGVDTWMERRVFKGASAIIARNQEALGVLRRRGYSGPLTHLPWAVDTHRFKPRKTDVDQPYTIGYVGRFVEEKGILDLVMASSSMCVEHRLLLVGDGPQKEEVKARLAGSDNVEFIPVVDHAKMAELYHRMDVLVLPSRSGRYWKEQFGRVLAEAMSSAVVPVGSDSGAIGDVIGEAGLVYPEGDVSALALALDRLADTGFRRKLMERALERAREKYSWAAWALNTSILLHDLTEAGKYGDASSAEWEKS